MYYHVEDIIVMAEILCWSREERIDDFREKLNVSPRIFTDSCNEPANGLLVLIQWSTRTVMSNGVNESAPLRHRRGQSKASPALGLRYATERGARQSSGRVVGDSLRTSCSEYLFR